MSVRGSAARPALLQIGECLRFNVFRLLGIAQDIKRRVLEGNASSARAGELAARIPQIAARAWSFAERAGA